MPVNNKNHAADSVESFTFNSVGTIQSSVKYHYEAPRQSVYAATGAFLLWNDPVYAQAAEDLQGFDRIWLVWVFNLNKHTNWRPKVRVPVPAERDMYSVFATRSPYRPNPIGMSAVELLEITPEGLHLGACDLLDGTAVLDVKPYIPEVDAFPDSSAGWRDRIDRRVYQINWSGKAAAQAEYIAQHGGIDLKNFCLVQLSNRPTDRSRKRLEFDGNLQQWVLHCRTWKVFFTSCEEAQTVDISAVESNYSAGDLADGSPDIYNDKALHRLFIQWGAQKDTLG